MRAELGGDGMRRRVMAGEESPGGFIKPEGKVKLDVDKGYWSAVYPVLDGVKVGVWNQNYYSNWMKIRKYNASMELIGDLNWQWETTLTQSDCAYFQAGYSKFVDALELHATWL